MAGRRQKDSETNTTKHRGKDGRWHARVTVGRRIDGQLDRPHLHRKTKREFDEAVRALERDRDAGKRTWLQGEQTPGGWLDHWMPSVLPLSVRWKTLSTYQSLMNVHVIPKMGTARLADVRPEALELLYGQLLNEGTSRTGRTSSKALASAPSARARQ